MVPAPANEPSVRQLTRMIESALAPLRCARLFSESPARTAYGIQPSGSTRRQTVSALGVGVSLGAGVGLGASSTRLRTPWTTPGLPGNS